MHSPPLARDCPALESHQAVSWYVPDDTTDTEELDAWCRATGPVVIDSVPYRQFGELLEGDSLAVLVWNIAAGSGDILTVIRDELGFDCETGYALNSRGPHFVMLLQEALRVSADVPATEPDFQIPPAVVEFDRPGPRLGVVEVARRCGLALSYMPATRNGTAEYDGLREDKGNAILSTLPLSDFIGIEAPMVAQRRVSAGATVHGPQGDSLRLVSAHINTFPGPWRTLVTGASSRLRQSLSIVDALRRAELERAGAARETLAACYPYCSDEETAECLISTITAGDFNTGSNHETALLHLWENFPNSPPSHGQHTSRSFPTDHLLFRHNYDYGSEPDRILEGTYRLLGSKYNSDHYPLIAWFRFGN